MRSASTSGTKTEVVNDNEFNRQELAAIIHLLDHNIKDDKYSNTIISAIAIIGIKEEGG